MNNDIYIFEVSEQSFAESVIFNSYKLPVVVEFMAIWSEPCALMADLFASLATEFTGQFIFAKVDIEEQMGLRDEYGIKNVPSLVVFKDGKPVRTEEGQLQEVEARGLLKDFGVFRESDVLREEARDKHLSGDTSAAILLLTQAIQQDPANTRIAMDMTQIFIDMGELEQAQGLFAKIPEKDKLTEMGKALSGQLAFAELARNTEDLEALTSKLAAQHDDSQLHFDIAIRLVAAYQYEEAINHLFIILDEEPDYKEGAAKEMIITIANMLAPVNSDLAAEFRLRLANLMSE